MLCPKCKKEMTVTNEHEIELDFCEECEGIWFDYNELDGLLGKNAKLSFDKCRRETTPHNEDMKHATCPRCQQRMTKVQIEVDMIIDFCEDCNGIWLDGGEFERIRSKNPFA